MRATATSLRASPLPTPSSTRPGYRLPRVPNACATTAGLYRKVAVSTLVPSTTRSVRSPTAAIHAKENGACPPWCRQGWKWSLTITLSSPTCSASTEYSTRSRGPNCSADAL